MRILIVKTSSLGDIIHAFPVVQYLKYHIPLCEIDWVVEHSFAELLQAHPSINRVFCIQTKKWRSQIFNRKAWKEINSFQRELRGIKYDVVLDLQGNFKSGIITAFARSSCKVGFAFSSVSEWPNLLTTNKKFNPPKGQNIRDDYLFLAKCALKEILTDGECSIRQEFISEGIQLELSLQQQEQQQPILDQLKYLSGLKVIVCPGSNWANKQLSLESLHSLLSQFLTRCEAHFLFVWGNQPEKEIAQHLHAFFPRNSIIIDRVSLPTLQNLMAHVDLVIAMDSLPLHLAGTTTTSTFSVFGPSSANKYHPVGPQHIAFQGSCPYGKDFEKRCSILRTCKTGACMKQLNGEQLFEYFRRKNGCF